MIEIHHLNKNFYVNKINFPALKDINLRINTGEIFGFVGESGAGKSTLLRMINLLETPSAGKIIIDNIDLNSATDRKLKEIRQQIAVIFQHYNLLECKTAFENIALPLEIMGWPRKKITGKVTELLHWIGLKKHAGHYPAQLSGGQKQRLAIARALAVNPKIILCDEPTSALDPKSTHAILHLLKEVRHKFNVTIVIITHEMNIIKQICDRAAIMHHGEIVEVGTPIDLFAKPKSAVTLELVQKLMHIELPAAIKKHLKTKPSHGSARLVRLTFLGDDSSTPLISSLVKNFSVTVNILQANIEHVQNVIIGFTICLVSGEEENIKAALAFAQTPSTTAEIIGYV